MCKYYNTCVSITTYGKHIYVQHLYIEHFHLKVILDWIFLVNKFVDHLGLTNFANKFLKQMFNLFIWSNLFETFSKENLQVYSAHQFVWEIGQTIFFCSMYLNKFCKQICWANFVSNFLIKFVEQIFWSNFLIKFFDQICWSNLLSKFVDQICWTNFLIKFVDQICWANLLNKFVNQILN
jgi:hypothetical protein